MTPPFVGLTGPSLVSSLVELSESVYPRGLEQAPHGHQVAYVTAVADGAYEERIGAGTRQVSRGALLYHPAGEEHSVRFVAPRTRVFRIQPRTALVSEARLAGASIDLAFCDTGTGILSIVARLHHAYQAADPSAPLLLDGLACEIIALAAARGSRRAPNRAGAIRAREMLDARIDRPPTLLELAAAANCHPITLARAFRQAFGTSIGGYARRRRLEVACALLHNKQLPISAVAARAGFSDQPHLTRSLRRATTLTPAAYRAAVCG